MLFKRLKRKKAEKCIKNIWMAHQRMMSGEDRTHIAAGIFGKSMAELVWMLGIHDRSGAPCDWHDVQSDFELMDEVGK